METKDIVRAWGRILQGRAPSVSIEITRECPLRCPGCYAYDDNHLGGSVTLRQLSDYKGEALIQAILEVADELKPLHLSLVGGDPLVRYRELDQVIPQLLDRGIHVQVVTSAFRQLNPSWIGLKHMNITVSVDGLPAEHDVRRKPATYERILKSIAGHQVVIHCTITSQMTARAGYLEDFVKFWSAQKDAAKIRFSIFTPQIGASDPEILSPVQRAEVIKELLRLRKIYPKIAMPESMVNEFLHPPKSPEECIFAKTTETISADFKTKISPCQFGGNPDCSQCGCIASMALAAVGTYKLGGILPVGSIFRTSFKIGTLNKARRTPAPDPLRVLP